jgi:hypothetical protein
MPKVNLSGMSVEALMDLRKRVEARLVEHRAQLEKQLERMGIRKLWASISKPVMTNTSLWSLPPVSST